MLPKAVVEKYGYDKRLQSISRAVGRFNPAGKMTDLNDYRLLGKSGLRVSPLSLGAMTFGEDWGWGADKDESKNQFDLFAERGGNFIDTANAYTMGSSEKLVGEFIASDRDYWVVATKYSLGINSPHNPNAGGNQRKNLMNSLDESLRRLNTDYIDLYYVHGWEFRTRPQEVMRAMDDAVRMGKILYLGVSNTPAWTIAQCNVMAELQGWSEFVALQMQYSLVEHTSDNELLPMCRAFGIGTTPWSPLAFGLLSGKYSSKDLEVDDASNARLQMMKESGVWTERNLRIADEVIRIAGEIDQSPAQVALNWVCAQPDITSPILGARTCAQLEDNLGALDFELEATHLAALNEVSKVELVYPYSALANSTGIDAGLSIEPSIESFVRR